MKRKNLGYTGVRGFINRNFLYKKDYKRIVRDIKGLENKDYKDENTEEIIKSIKTLQDELMLRVDKVKFINLEKYSTGTILVNNHNLELKKSIVIIERYIGLLDEQLDNDIQQ